MNMALFFLGLLYVAYRRIIAPIGRGVRRCWRAGVLYREGWRWRYAPEIGIRVWHEPNGPCRASSTAWAWAARTQLRRRRTDKSDG